MTHVLSMGDGAHVRVERRLDGTLSSPRRTMVGTCWSIWNEAKAPSQRLQFGCPQSRSPHLLPFPDLLAGRVARRSRWMALQGRVLEKRVGWTASAAFPTFLPYPSGFILPSSGLLLLDFFLDGYISACF